ncbi:MAG: hypothetical protein V4439_01085 [Patescibacteria group bacterium]
MENIKTVEIKKENKFIKWALIFGIVVVLNLFFNYAVALVYKQPVYEDYFRAEQIVEPIINKEDCVKVGGQWTEQNYTYYDKTAPMPVSPDGKPIKGYCDPNFTKQQEFNSAQKIYDRNVFITLVILGVISLAIGLFTSIELLSTALSFGGVLSFIIASSRYWSSADNLIKVIILAIALAALIWLAVKKFGK